MFGHLPLGRYLLRVQLVGCSFSDTVCWLVDGGPQCNSKCHTCMHIHNFHVQYLPKYILLVPSPHTFFSAQRHIILSGRRVLSTSTTLELATSKFQRSLRTLFQIVFSSNSPHGIGSPRSSLGQGCLYLHRLYQAWGRPRRCPGTSCQRQGRSSSFFRKPPSILWSLQENHLLPGTLHVLPVGIDITLPPPSSPRLPTCTDRGSTYLS